MDDIRETLHTLVTANHILHFHDVLDAYGHISIRHPKSPSSKFIMSASMPPALVESTSDLVEYYIDDAAPVNPDSPKGFIERYIHSELYKRYPDVHCVIHSHADAVLPYAVSSATLRPVVYIAGFLQHDVKVWDIVSSADASQSDMLVRTAGHGASLAKEFTSNPNEVTSSPEETVVLMKHHGFTTWGSTIELAVFRAVYTAINARLQTQASIVQPPGEGPMQGVSTAQTKDFFTAIEPSHGRGWSLWVREVEANPLYRNKV